MLFLLITTPLLQQHPFPPLYASAVFAVWLGDRHEALVAVLLSVVVTAIFMPPIPALPLEGRVFIVAQLLMLIAIRQWRITRDTMGMRSYPTIDELEAEA